MESQASLAEGVRDAAVAATGPCIYLYCFARPGAVAALARTDGDREPPIDELVARDVAAVFRTLLPEELAALTVGAQHTDPEGVIRLALNHERRIEAIMAHSPVLPVRLGALFSSREALIDLLRRRRRTIAEFLDRVAGKEEWAAKLIVDGERAARCLAEHDPQFAERWQRLPQAPGMRYLQEKRFWADVRKEVQARLGHTVAHVQEALYRSAQICSTEVCHCLAAPASLEAQQAMPGRPSSGTGCTIAQADFRLLQQAAIGSTGPALVWHGAFLLDTQARLSFCATAEELRRELAAQGLQLELSGPWPAYSFCPDMDAAP